MKRSRGQRAGLTRERVIAEAANLIEKEGYSALSMRRVAQRLEVAPNALYAHVSDRVDLVDGVLDRQLARVTPPMQGSPRAQLTELMHRVRTALISSPDLAPLYGSRRTIGPEALRIGHATIQLLAALGMETPQCVYAMKALMIFTIGSAVVDLPTRSSLEHEDSEKTFTLGLALFLDSIH